MNVIPKAGQVWISDGTNTSRTIHSLSVGGVNFIGGDKTDSKRLREYWTFKPANDLEWLAVNVILWNGDIYGNDHKLTRRGYDDWAFTYDGFTRQQWQDKRNELFGKQESEMNIDKMAKEEVEPVTMVNGDRVWYQNVDVGHFIGMSIANSAVVQLNRETSHARGGDSYGNYNVKSLSLQPIKTESELFADELASIIKGSPMDLGYKGLAKYIINNGYRKDTK